VLAGKAVAVRWSRVLLAGHVGHPGQCRLSLVLYDMEHTGLGFETLKWLFASCRGLPIEPMVRVPRGEYTFLSVPSTWAHAA
jgi:hypothetical protein